MQSVEAEQLRVRVTRPFDRQSQGSRTPAAPDPAERLQSAATSAKCVTLLQSQLITPSKWSGPHQSSSQLVPEDKQVPIESDVGDYRDNRSARKFISELDNDRDLTHGDASGPQSGTTKFKGMALTSSVPQRAQPSLGPQANRPVPPSTRGHALPSSTPATASKSGGQSLTLPLAHGVTGSQEMTTPGRLQENSKFVGSTVHRATEDGEKTKATRNDHKVTIGGEDETTLEQLSAGRKRVEDRSQERDHRKQEAKKAEMKNREWEVKERESTELEAMEEKASRDVKANEAQELARQEMDAREARATSQVSKHYTEETNEQDRNIMTSKSTDKAVKGSAFKENKVEAAEGDNGKAATNIERKRKDKKQEEIATDLETSDEQSIEVYPSKKPKMNAEIDQYQWKDENIDQSVGANQSEELDSRGRRFLDTAKTALRHENDRVSRDWGEKWEHKDPAQRKIALENELADAASERKRVSTTPPIPRGIKPRAKMTGQEVSSPERAPTRGVGIDAQLPVSRTIKRSVSFADEVSSIPNHESKHPHSERHVSFRFPTPLDDTTGPLNMDSDRLMRTNGATSPGRKVEATEEKRKNLKKPAVKETPVYPPGMGLDDIDRISSSQETQPRMRESLVSAKRLSKNNANERRLQDTLSIVRDVKGTKKEDTSAHVTEIRTIIPAEEIIISSDDESSIISYDSSGADSYQSPSPAAQGHKESETRRTPNTTHETPDSGPPIVVEPVEDSGAKLTDMTTPADTTRYTETKTRNEVSFVTQADPRSSSTSISSNNSRSSSAARYLSDSSGSELGEDDANPHSDAESVEEVKAPASSLLGAEGRSEEIKSTNGDDSRPAVEHRLANELPSLEPDAVSIRSSPSLPENTKDLDRYLQQDAQRSSQLSVPARSSQKSGRPSILRKQVQRDEIPDGKVGYPSLTQLRTDKPEQSKHELEAGEKVSQLNSKSNGNSKSKTAKSMHKARNQIVHTPHEIESDETEDEDDDRHDKAQMHEAKPQRAKHIYTPTKRKHQSTPMSASRSRHPASRPSASTPSNVPASDSGSTSGPRRNLSLSSGKAVGRFSNLINSMWPFSSSQG